MSLGVNAINANNILNPAIGVGANAGANAEKGAGTTAPNAAKSSTLDAGDAAAALISLKQVTRVNDQGGKQLIAGSGASNDIVNAATGKFRTACGGSLDIKG